MHRAYLEHINRYSKKKITIIIGPRQSGKTTLVSMLEGDNLYLNYDFYEHQKIIRDRAWDRKKDAVIFDEIHKMPKWKQWLKGIFDVEGTRPQLFVTGSARLDTMKKVGDSLAGRYFSYRLHPFDLRELALISPDISPNEALERLLKFGGFPEPFIENDPSFYLKWSKTHQDIILKQDLIEIEDVRDIRSIELLNELMRSKVGSPLSISSLVEDVQVSDKTIKKWINILENLYIIFSIKPFHKNIAKSNLKRSKYYFFDNARVEDEAAKLENLVATSLIKECHFRQDCLGEDWDLFYLSKRGGIEIDFLITKNKKPHIMIEVKTSDDRPSSNFQTFANDLKGVKCVQLVKNLKMEKVYPNGVEIRDLANWLRQW